MSLTVTLARIEQWLVSNASTTAASLRPGADLAVIDAAARAMGVKFLPDVTRLLLWHNGSVAKPQDSFELAPHLGFLDLDGILAAWNIHAQVFDDPDDEPGTRYSNRWIPIATDWCGGHLVIDHRDGGTAGRAFFFDPELGPRIDAAWPSIADLVGEQLAALNGDRPFRDSRPTVTGGTLTWLPENPAPRVYRDGTST